MKSKYLLGVLALIALSSAPQSLRAWGGSCPTGANYLQEPGNANVTLATLGVNFCIFVSAGGSDSNTGLSEAQAFLHAPGMTGCTSNCSTTAQPGPGQGVIFRGGDTWHYGNGTTTSTGLPWTCGYSGATCSGSAGSPVYIGVDLTWYSGASWTRPIFNMDNPLSTSTVGGCTYDDGVLTGPLNHEPVFFYNTSYLIFDDFEFKGYCWDKYSGTYIYEVGNNIEILRLYFHGWTYVSEVGANCNSGYCDTNHMITGSGNAGTFAYNVFDGTDSPPLSGFALYAQNAQDVHNSFFNHLSNPFVGGPVHVFHDNYASNITLSYDGTTHANVYEFLSAYPGNNLIYNNIVFNALNDGGVKWWIRTGTQTSTDYLFNNVFYGNTNDNCLIYTQAVSGTTTNTVNFLNNTMDSCTVQFAGNSVTFGYKGTVNFENNHLIGYGALNLSAVWTNGTGPYAGAATVNDLGGNIYQTEATANGQGYLPATSYAPTSPSGSTVGAGTNLTSQCGTLPTALCSDTTLGGTRTPNTRPATGAWDSGAYEFTGSGGNPPVITSPLNYNCPVSNSCTYQITATNSPSSFTASGYPTCMSFNNSTGALSGTCVSAVTYTVALGALNSYGTGSATLTLNWIASSPAVGLTPPNLIFYPQTVGTTSGIESVTLTNTGVATLTISSISITGTNAADFAQSNTCGSSVSAGANCTISVTFTPSIVGAESAAVSISDNATGSPQTVSLSGTGVTAPPPIPSNVILLQ